MALKDKPGFGQKLDAALTAWMVELSLVLGAGFMVGGVLVLVYFAGKAIGL